MSRIINREEKAAMEFDNAIGKAKDIVKVAAKKTERIVVTEKKKVEITILRTKREKDFAELGRLYFERLRKEDAPDGDEKIVVARIREKNKRIAALINEINTAGTKQSGAEHLDDTPSDGEYCPGEEENI